MVYKKTKKNIKNRRKTKRKQKGGTVIQISRLANKAGIPMANLLEERPYSQTKEYGEMALSNKQFGVVPFYSSFSMTELLPELNGEEGDLIDLITGKPVDGLQLKQKVMFNHSARDMQMFELNRFFLSQIDINDDFTKEMIRILTKKGLYKKILCLRILVYIYFGKAGINPDKSDINESIININDIHKNPIFDRSLRVDVIPLEENGKIYYQKDFDFVKQYFDLDNKVTKISTNIYSNGLLMKCYEDITDDDIKSLMNQLPAVDRKKYKLVYSEKNNRTYDNIRYLLINASIISQTLTGMVSMEALITPDERAAVANPGLQAANPGLQAANPGLQAANPGLQAANIEELAQREAEARQLAINVAIAANNRRAVEPNRVVEPAPIQNENIAVIAALADMENNRPNPARQNIPPAINNAELAAAIVAANP